MHRNTHSRAVGGSVETPRAILAGLYELYYGIHCTTFLMDWQEKIPGKCCAFAGECCILLHGDAALLELLDHQIQVRLDVNGLAGGLDGIGHVL